MADLILKFTDERGERRAVAVTTERFSIGRTPDNDLAVASSALSRKHAEIQRFADVFIITDNNSSNGTKLNGRELTEPVALNDGDQLTLGGAIEMVVEIHRQTTADFADHAANSGRSENSKFSSPNMGQAVPFWQSAYFIAPVFGVVFCLLVGVLIFVLNGGQPPISRINRDLSEDPTEETNHRRSPRNRNSADDSNDDEPPANSRIAENKSDNENDNSSAEPSNKNSNAGNTNAMGASSEDEKIEGLALKFLRSISDNQNPVLNSKQVALIKAKIQVLKSSSAFRDNLKAASKNAQSFEKIGQEHNLKGSFLAAAALSKLNDARGDAAVTAAAMAPELQKYALVLGTELANDNLLSIAGYAEGNPPNAVRDRVAALTLTPGTTAATVRTIWFLRDNNKLSESAFDFAVRFIAAGTILQNPSAFNF